MPRNSLALGVTGALFALACGVTAANAASAYASSTVNVRSGPGTGYSVVDVLRPGQRVEVDYCKGAWCVIEQRGADGWVNANYLTADRYNDDDRYYDDDDYYDDGSFFIDRPRYRYRTYPFFRSQACFGGPNTSFCFRD
jgi:uncharacterized protein YraI